MIPTSIDHQIESVNLLSVLNDDLLARNLPIRTDNGIIRRVEERDLEAFYDLEIDREVKKYLVPVTTPRDEWIANGKRMLLTLDVLAIEAKSDSAFAGRATLARKINPSDLQNYFDNSIHWELQIVIAKKYWGRRFGEEVARALIDSAFTEPMTASICAIVHPDNQASRSLVSELRFVLDSDGSQSQPEHLKFVLTRSSYFE